MASDFDEKAALKLCRGKDTPAKVLKTLAGKSAKVDRLIAKHPHADASVLGKLSGSLDIKTFECLLLNPHAPFETVLAIASSLIAGEDRGQRIDAISAELERLLAGQITGYSIRMDRITVDESAILPPGVQRIYRIPHSEPKARKLLQDCLKSPDREQLAIQMAKDKKTPADVLAALLGCSVSIDRLIAKHPNANERVLDELLESKDKTTRRNVFFNPNTDKQSVIKLAAEFSDGFLKLKPEVLDSLVRHDPQNIYGIEQATLSGILRHPQCPRILLNWACKHGGAYEQLAVWKNPNAPVELLSEMMERGYPQEANVLLAHPRMILEYVSDLGLIGLPPNSYEELCDYGGWLRETSEKVSGLWEELVPKEGDAETIQGEMVRAIGRIQGDYYRNGFGNWYSYYYDLSQSLAAHLADEATFKPFTANVIQSDIRALHSCGLRCMYSGDLERTFLDSINDMEEVFLRIDTAIAVWCERHPELIPYKQAN